MKRGKILVAVGVMGVVLAIVGSPMAAQAAEVSPKQLLDEAEKLYAAHNYDGALKRLQQVKPADLGFFEKGTYKSLLEKTQKAVTGKAADEKAFADGKEALSKKRFGTAVEKLTQAANSKYLDAEKAGPAKGLLRLAKDGHEKALAQAKTLLAQAAADAKAGKMADARKTIQQVEAMDVHLGRAESQALADATKAIAAAEAKPPPTKVAAKPTPPKPEPKKPAGPTSSDLYAEAKKQYKAGDYEAAHKTIAKIDRKQLGLFEQWGYDGLVKDVNKAVAGRAAAEKALKDGQDALQKKQYAAAVKSLSEAASSKYLAAEERKAAETALAKAKDAQAKAVAAAKPEPKKPAGPTASDLYAEAKKQYKAGDYEAADKTIAKIDRKQLGLFGQWGYDRLARDIKKAISGRAAAEKALADGRAALTKKRYTVALENLSQAASCQYLPPDKGQAAKAAYQMAKDEHTKAVANARDLIAKAKDALTEGKAAEARKMVDQVKAMDVDLGWWTSRDLKGLDSRVTSVEAAMVASAAKPPAKPTKVAQGPEKKPEPKPTAKPAEKPAAKPPAKPTAKPAAKPTAKPAPKPTAKPAPKPKFDPAAIAKQASRARAEEEIELGDAALAKHEYQKAKTHFSRAMGLWPESAKAKQGLDRAMKLLAEREEPLGDVVRDVRALERQRIIAGVQDLLAEAERRMARAERPEDYVEAERPLAQADRTIDVAPVLTVEEQERLREEVYDLRKDIRARQAAVESKRRAQAEQEAVEREKQRRIQDRLDRESKVNQLWQRAEELRKSMQFGESIEMLDRLIAIDPNDERALRWREDLLYLEAQARQVQVRSVRESGAVEAITDTEKAATHPGEEIRGVVTYLRYPEAKAWKDLTDFRREFTQAVSAEPKAVAETRRRLKEPIDLDFEKTSLDNVLKYISEVQRGLNIVIDPDVSTAGIDLSTRVVDLKVKQVEVESVLGLILGADLGYKVESGYILVTTREKLQQNLPVVTYPVQDLVAQIPDFGGEAPRFEVGDVTQAAAAAAGGGGFGDLFGGAATTPTEEPIGWQELVDIIQRTVNNQADPNVAAWSDEGGPAAIEYMNGLLIVTQTRQGHEKVADLLEQLRRERAIMISVESRFCTVTDEFLQDITLDIDAAFVDTGDTGFTGPSGAPFAPIQDPGAQNAVADPLPYDTLPGVPPDVTFPALQGQPIIVSGTGSNQMGTATLLPVGGTVFGTAGWTALPNQGGMVVSGVFLDDIQVGFLLRAIQADVRSTMLQAPRVTLYNGQRSYISVSTVTTYIADVEPVVAEAAVGWDPTIGAIPVGVTLDVKATVSADRRYVQMDLRPQVADIEGWDESTVTAAVPALGIATATIDLPRVRVQDFKTTVSVPDGGTLLLGGTRQFIEGEAETGVPVLSKVPLLKRLFDNRATVRRANNLLILMKPKILIQAEEEAKLGYDDF